MLNACEALGGRASHPLGGTVGAFQARSGLLKFQQLAVQAVVDRVFHGWRIEHVIRMGCRVEQIAQFRGPFALIRH